MKQCRQSGRARRLQSVTIQAYRTRHSPPPPPHARNPAHVHPTVYAPFQRSCATTAAAARSRGIRFLNITATTLLILTTTDPHSSSGWWTPLLPSSYLAGWVLRDTTGALAWVLQNTNSRTNARNLIFHNPARHRSPTWAEGLSVAGSKSVETPPGCKTLPSTFPKVLPWMVERSPAYYFAAPLDHTTPHPPPQSYPISAVSPLGR